MLPSHAQGENVQSQDTSEPSPDSAPDMVQSQVSHAFTGMTQTQDSQEPSTPSVDSVLEGIATGDASTLTSLLVGLGISPYSTMGANRKALLSWCQNSGTALSHTLRSRYDNVSDGEGGVTTFSQTVRSRGDHDSDREGGGTDFLPDVTAPHAADAGTGGVPPLAGFPSIVQKRRIEMASQLPRHMNMPRHGDIPIFPCVPAERLAWFLNLVPRQFQGHPREVIRNEIFRTYSSVDRDVLCLYDEKMMELLYALKPTEPWSTTDHASLMQSNVVC